MKHFRKSTLILIFSLSISMIILSGNAFADSYNGIFEWVKSEMKIEKDCPMPSVRIVEKEELNEVFLIKFDESYKKIEKQLGEEEAKRIKEFYLEEVVGLFIPETKAIYVSNLRDNGKRESIIAHEIAHYLQDASEGLIDPDGYMSVQKRVFREMQAEGIGEKFLKTFHGDE